MKTLVYKGPKQLAFETRDLPSLDAGEVILKIGAAGICGSDMHAWHGHDSRRKPGLVLGHEFAGQIEASSNPDIKVGSRWTGNPLIACGKCEYCLQGRSNLCAFRAMVGMTRAGAFAEYMSIPASCLVEIPEGMTEIAAALTEPAATAWHATHLSARALVRPLHECKTLVIGGGAVGMLCALLLRHLGVPELLVAEVNPRRSETVVKEVRCDVIDPRSAAATSDHFDLVIDAVGGSRTRQQAIAAVKPGGVVTHIGLQDSAGEVDMRKITLQEITLLGTYTYTTNDLRATVRGLSLGQFGDLGWVEARPLKEGPSAFIDLDAGVCASPKVILVP